MAEMDPRMYFRGPPPLENGGHGEITQEVNRESHYGYSGAGYKTQKSRSRAASHPYARAEVPVYRAAQKRSLEEERVPEKYGDGRKRGWRDWGWSLAVKAMETGYKALLVSSKDSQVKQIEGARKSSMDDEAVPHADAVEQRIAGVDEPVDGLVAKRLELLSSVQRKLTEEEYHALNQLLSFEKKDAKEEVGREAFLQEAVETPAPPSVGGIFQDQAATDAQFRRQARTHQAGVVLEDLLMERDGQPLAGPLLQKSNVLQNLDVQPVKESERSKEGGAGFGEAEVRDLAVSFITSRHPKTPMPLNAVPGPSPARAGQLLSGRLQWDALPPRRESLGPAQAQRQSDAGPGSEPWTPAWRQAPAGTSEQPEQESLSVRRLKRASAALDGDFFSDIRRTKQQRFSLGGPLQPSGEGPLTVGFDESSMARMQQTRDAGTPGKVAGEGAHAVPLRQTQASPLLPMLAGKQTSEKQPFGGTPNPPSLIALGPSKRAPPRRSWGGFGASQGAGAGAGALAGTLPGPREPRKTAAAPVATPTPPPRSTADKILSRLDALTASPGVLDWRASLHAADKMSPLRPLEVRQLGERAKRTMQAAEPPPPVDSLAEFVPLSERERGAQARREEQQKGGARGGPSGGAGVASGTPGLDYARAEKAIQETLARAKGKAKVFPPTEIEHQETPSQEGGSGGAGAGAAAELAPALCRPTHPRPEAPLAVTAGDRPSQDVPWPKRAVGFRMTAFVDDMGSDDEEEAPQSEATLRDMPASTPKPKDTRKSSGFAVSSPASSPFSFATTSKPFGASEEPATPRAMPSSAAQPSQREAEPPLAETTAEAAKPPPTPPSPGPTYSFGPTKAGPDFSEAPGALHSPRVPAEPKFGFTPVSPNGLSALSGKVDALQSASQAQAFAGNGFLAPVKSGGGEGGLFNAPLGKESSLKAGPVFPFASASVPFGGGDKATPAGESKTAPAAAASTPPSDTGLVSFLKQGEPSSSAGLQGGLAAGGLREKPSGAAAAPGGGDGGGLAPPSAPFGGFGGFGGEDKTPKGTGFAASTFTAGALAPGGGGLFGHIPLAAAAAEPPRQEPSATQTEQNTTTAPESSPLPPAFVFGQPSTKTAPATAATPTPTSAPLSLTGSLATSSAPAVQSTSFFASMAAPAPATTSATNIFSSLPAATAASPVPSTSLSQPLFGSTQTAPALSFVTPSLQASQPAPASTPSLSTPLAGSAAATPQVSIFGTPTQGQGSTPQPAGVPLFGGGVSVLTSTPTAKLEFGASTGAAMTTPAFGTPASTAPTPGFGGTPASAAPTPGFGTPTNPANPFNLGNGASAPASTPSLFQMPSPSTFTFGSAMPPAASPAVPAPAFGGFGAGSFGGNGVGMGAGTSSPNTAMEDSMAEEPVSQGLGGSGGMVFGSQAPGGTPGMAFGGGGTGGFNGNFGAPAQGPGGIFQPGGTLDGGQGPPAFAMGATGVSGERRMVKAKRPGARRK